MARRLREEHDFRGYIHLKTIPEASVDLIERAGRYADRLSINIELPTEQVLTASAPEKKFSGIRLSMARIHSQLDAHAAELKSATRNKPPRFAPAVETLWRTYYRSIFNPARLKTDMMKREMPVRYWKNLPEASDIHDLITNASARVHRMIEEGQSPALRRKRIGKLGARG